MTAPAPHRNGGRAAPAPRHLFYRVLPLALLLACAAPALAQSPEAVVSDVAGAIQEEASTQARADEWSAERQQLLDEQGELERYDLWLDHQLVKYEAYMAEHEKSLALLEARKKEAERIRLLLEPLLDDSLDELRGMVADDLPFLAQERTDRLASVQAVLNDYEAPLGEKLRRLLEALFIEAQYGSETTVTETVVQAGGTEIQGRALRLGRLAQYFLARDGQRAFRLDRSSGQWVPLDEDAAQSLSAALDMAQRLRPAGLVVLPGQAADQGGAQ